MSKLKVYVSDYDYPDLKIERSILEPIDAEVIGLQSRTGKELPELARDADAILQQYANIPRETIEKLTNCKAICRYGVGVDIVDVQAAHDHGIVVTNVPDYCIDEVADHTIALGLMLLRRIPAYNAATHAGRWHWQESGAPIFRFRNQIWGIVGFGRIARNMVHKIKPFGFALQAYDPYASETYMGTFGVQKADLEGLLKSSDIVTIMCPYTKETHHLIDESALIMMPEHAVLLNCSRGKVVDNQALYKALSEGWIASSGLDDTEEEPAKMDTWSPDMNPLFTLDNCIITPHVAYVSEDTLQECRRVAAENAKAILLGQTPPNLVKP